jgi:hypothetical protein
VSGPHETRRPVGKNLFLRYEEEEGGRILFMYGMNDVKPASDRDR